MPELAVYGFRLVGLPANGARQAPAGWPLWTIDQARAEPGADAPGLSIWPDRARMGMPGIGQVHLDRQAGRIRFEAFTRWPPEGLLHPGLGPAATVIAHWMDRISLHAAAVVVDGRAWGLLGGQGAGKSTLAALLAGQGARLLTDDLLVLDGRRAFAGPDAVDLREEFGRRLGGRGLGRLGARERWRKRLPPSEPSAPLAGFVELSWSDAGSIAAVGSAAERLAVLDGHLSLPADPQPVLDLVDLPMLRFRRLRDADRAEPGSAALLAHLREPPPDAG